VLYRTRGHSLFPPPALVERTVHHYRLLSTWSSRQSTRAFSMILFSTASWPGTSLSQPPLRWPTGRGRQRAHTPSSNRTSHRMLITEDVCVLGMLLSIILIHRTSRVALSRTLPAPVHASRCHCPWRSNDQWGRHMYSSPPFLLLFSEHRMEALREFACVHSPITACARRI
jgi:hypothetical protein